MPSIVTRQTISSIETGQRLPSALLAFVLADRLGKRVDEPNPPELASGSGEPHLRPT